MCKALEHWLGNVKGQSKLKKLLLSSCNLVIPMLPSLKSFSTLTEIDVSGKKIDDFYTFFR